MKNHQEQIMKALSGFIPEDAQKDVASAVSAFLDEAVAELQTAADARVEEVRKEYEGKVEEAQQTGYTGYSQAWDMILDLRERLEIQKEEFDAALEEGFEQAWQKIQEARQEAGVLETRLYEEYEKKLHDVKEFMVDKLDVFLSNQGEKYEERVRKELSNDPAIAEHKLAFDRILEVAADYLSDEDFAFATNSKVDTLAKQLDEAKAQIRMLDGKAMRLKVENASLTEAVRQKDQMLSESVKSTTKERLEKAMKVEGRGTHAPKAAKKVEVLIGEAEEPQETVVETTTKANNNRPFFEGVDESDIEQWNKTAFYTPGDID